MGAEEERSELCRLLREARRVTRLSQLELSLELGISARHLGFVEVGRSRPGRTLLLRWLERLEVPFGTRNEALRLAGHAPAYDDSTLGGPALAEARRALLHLIASHEPLPAVVLDADWRIVASNVAFRRLAARAGASMRLPGLGERLDAAVGSEVGPTPIDLALGPGGLGGSLVNVLEVAPAVLTHLRHDALSNPELRPVVEQVAPFVPEGQAPSVFPPVLVTRYATEDGELAFLSMFTTFGTPQSITLSSLRVELLFPADDATREVVTRWGAEAPGG